MRISFMIPGKLYKVKKFFVAQPDEEFQNIKDMQPDDVLLVVESRSYIWANCTSYCEFFFQGQLF